MFSRRESLMQGGLGVIGVSLGFPVFGTTPHAEQDEHPTANEAVTVVVDPDPDTGQYTQIANAIDDIDQLSQGDEGVQDVIIQVNQGQYTVSNSLTLAGVSDHSVRLQAAGTVELIFDSGNWEPLFRIEDTGFGTELPVEDPEAIEHRIVISGFDFLLDDYIGVVVAENAQNVVLEQNTFDGTAATDALPVAINPGGHVLSVSNNKFIEIALSITTAQVVWITKIVSNRFEVSGNSDVVYLVSTNVGQMTENRIQGGRHGVNLFGSVVDRFERNQLENGTSLGLWVSDSTIWDCVDNDIQSYRDGVRISSSSGIDTLTDNRIINHDDVGLHIGTNGIVRTVADNTISENEQGILLESRDDGFSSHIDDLRSNLISENSRVGVQCGHNTYIEQARHNRLSANSEALVFAPVNDSDTRANLDQTVFEDNVLGQPQEVGVRIADGYQWDGQLDCRDNWWGDTSGPSGGVDDPVTGSPAAGDGSEIIVGPHTGAVRFDPQRSTPPEEAPDGPDRPTVDEYMNEEGIVDADGLRAAIADWRAGDIEISLLRDVILKWRRAR